MGLSLSKSRLCFWKMSVGGGVGAVRSGHESVQSLEDPVNHGRKCSFVSFVYQETM